MGMHHSLKKPSSPISRIFEILVRFDKTAQKKLRLAGKLFFLTVLVTSYKYSL